MVLTRSVHSDEYKRFLNLLISKRKKSGISQCALSVRLGYTANYAQKCESGTRELNIIEVRDWLLALGESPVTFMAELEKMTVADVISVKCNLCGTKWVPRRLMRPKRCPHCGSDRWDQGRKRPPMEEQRKAARERRV